MISVSLARRLLSAGLIWEPRPGDAFVVPDRGMDDEVFYVSQMTVDVHHFPDGRVIGFNGTTEWAMDSIALTEALWLPGETALREELGPRLHSLLRDGAEWVVRLAPAGDPAAADPAATDQRSGAGLPANPGVGPTFRASEAAEAYGLALLSVLDFGSRD